MDHACEMETSLQLLLRPELVRPAGARANYGAPLPRGETSFSSCDMYEPSTVFVPRDYSLTDPEGHVGDPTVATAETGRLILEAELEELVAFLEEFHDATPRPPR
jgi:creatinine amidohydrolase